VPLPYYWGMRRKNSARSHFLRQIVHYGVKLPVDFACWIPRAHHKLIELALAEGSLLSVILLVASMEFHELHCLFVDI